jgi:hypothetical protein
MGFGALGLETPTLVQNPGHQESNSGLLFSKAVKPALRELEAEVTGCPRPAPASNQISAEIEKTAEWSPNSWPRASGRRQGSVLGQQTQATSRKHFWNSEGSGI